jgi:Tfp pilus assembly protein PilZ
LAFTMVDFSRAKNMSFPGNALDREVTAASHYVQLRICGLGYLKYRKTLTIVYDWHRKNENDYPNLLTSWIEKMPDLMVVNSTYDKNNGFTTMKSSDFRKYPRVTSDIEVVYGIDGNSSVSSNYLRGIAENCSFGGMFLVTDENYPIGSILRLDFYPVDEEAVSATAVVTWRRRFRQPHGIGLKFAEFEHIGERDFKKLMERMFAPLESGVI